MRPTGLIRSTGAGAVAGACLLAAACGGSSGERVLLGATHTLEDSGLLPVLTREFEADHPEYDLSVVVAGTGEILEMARRGDFDVTVTHAPEAEAALVAAGVVQVRQPVMHNAFVLLGPPGDPAAAAQADDAPAALRRIRDAQAAFVSRADDSGTHRKELALWADAEIVPGWEGYIRAGAGMAEALRIAAQRDAYVLSDRATFEVMRDELPLRIVQQGQPRLLNPYSVMVMVDAANRDGAHAFADWIRGADAQRTIGSFGRDADGRPLFMPDAVVSDSMAVRP